MQYGFDQPIDRIGTASLKWSGCENELPMWVADMDFAVAPEIVAALRQRLEHPVYGYCVLPDAWYRAIISWWQERHGFTLQKDWLLFVAGIVPAISSIIRKLTTPGENILVLSPVYNAFFRTIEDNGRRALESPLRQDGSAYSIHYADLEAKLADQQTTLFLLSNPHNPTGNLWDRETLAHIGDLCHKHRVLVVADEIHCDLTDPGCAYVPFASVSEACAQNSITCIAPTKAFNIAGIVTSAVAVPDAGLRHKVACAFHTDGIDEANVFAAEAAIAAFTKGAPWLDALREYLFGNKAVVRAFLAQELPQIVMAASQSTYLLWLDCGAVADSATKLSRFLRKEAGLWLSDGSQFRGPQKACLRMNIACPRARVEEGLRRLKTGVEAYRKAFPGGAGCPVGISP